MNLRYFVIENSTVDGDVARAGNVDRDCISAVLQCDRYLRVGFGGPTGGVPGAATPIECDCLDGVELDAGREIDGARVHAAVTIEVHAYVVAGLVVVDRDVGALARFISVAANGVDAGLLDVRGKLAR